MFLKGGLFNILLVIWFLVELKLVLSIIVFFLFLLCIGCNEKYWFNNFFLFLWMIWVIVLILVLEKLVKFLFKKLIKWVFCCNSFRSCKVEFGFEVFRVGVMFIIGVVFLVVVAFVFLVWLDMLFMFGDVFLFCIRVIINNRIINVVSIICRVFRLDGIIRFIFILFFLLMYGYCFGL